MPAALFPDAGISRRTLARGAAWSVPAVALAAAAPAMATSVDPCTVTSNFDGLKLGTTPSVLTFAPSTITADISYTSSGNDNDPTPGNTGKVSRTTSTPAWNYLEIQQLSPLNAGDTVTVTLKFSEPVTGLSFKIHDIDAELNKDRSVAWIDYVVVRTAGFSYTSGKNLTGNGTARAPFRNTTSYDNPISSGLADVKLTWTGEIQTVSFSYVAGAKGNAASQHIALGALSFQTCD